jgi:hypothetical protein
VPFVHLCHRLLPRAIQENGFLKEDGGRCSQQQKIGGLQSDGPVQPKSSPTEEPAKTEDVVIEATEEYTIYTAAS